MEVCIESEASLTQTKQRGRVRNNNHGKLYSRIHNLVYFMSTDSSEPGNNAFLQIEEKT